MITAMRNAICFGKCTLCSEKKHPLALSFLHSSMNVVSI